jgi:hypothetical protein
MRTAEAARYPWPAVVATAGVAAFVLGPLLVSGGVALRGDMVFTPDQPWKPAGLGLDGSVPRAVPMDALVSLVDEVLPGAVLQRLLLIAAFAAGGLGVARMTRAFSARAQVAAVVVYLWNPWVYERLAIGQWPIVLGYGLLPWIVVATLRVRDGRRLGWPAAMLLLALAAACGPSVGLIAAAVAVVLLAASRAVVLVLRVLGLSAIANLPWIVPAVLGPGPRGAGGQFGYFAAHGESALGTVASVLSMGGIWKTSVLPPERTHVLVVAVAGLLAVVFLLSLRYAVPVVGARTVAGVAALSVLTLVVALISSIGPVADALGSLSADWPALGILRDSHRYLAPLGLGLALGAAALVDRVVAAPIPDRAARGAIACVLIAAPVLLLPSMAWGLAGKMRPVEYPADWSQVAGRISSDEATVVLPWTGSYRGFAWNSDRAMLDPAPRFLSGDVLIDDRIFLHDGALPPEDPFLARVGTALRAPDASVALRALGVRWVLVEKENGVTAAEVPAGTTAYDGRWLRLVDLGHPTGDLGHWRPHAPGWIVLLGDAVVLCAVSASIWKLRRGLPLTRR